MSPRPVHVRRLFHKAGAVVAAALATVGLTACSTAGGAPGESNSPAAAPSVPTPLATSVRTAAGTWATVPMGRLDEPLNTFWQLFFRPKGTTSWSNQVEATATATNGGLVLASLSGRAPGGSSLAGSSLAVGIRPSVNLAFTPLIYSSGPASSWSNGLIDAVLASRLDALAGGPAGSALALVDQRGVPEVLSSAGGLSQWSRLVSEADLVGGHAGRSCGTGPLTAVGYLGGRPLIGASCGRAGAVGLFARSGRTWQLAGPALPGALARGRSEVLDIALGAKGTAVLLAVYEGGRTSVLAAWSRRGGKWSTSGPLALGAGEQLASLGPDGGGFFSLARTPSGQERLYTVTIARSGWRELAQPPAGTTTVAFGASGPVDALVAGSTVLTVWSLGDGSRRWARSEVVHVPIQFGSSS